MAGRTRTASLAQFRDHAGGAFRVHRAATARPQRNVLGRLRGTGPPVRSTRRAYEVKCPREAVALGERPPVAAPDPDAEPGPHPPRALPNRPARRRRRPDGARPRTDRASGPAPRG